MRGLAFLGLALLCAGCAGKPLTPAQRAEAINGYPAGPTSPVTTATAPPADASFTPLRCWGGAGPDSHCARIDPQ